MLAVIDQQKVPFANGREQLLPGDVDPEVHGVAAGQARILHLRAHAAL
jgi:hypothetical protein